MGAANANSTWQTSNGNVVGNTVQFDWRGGTATYVLNVADGSTISVVVDNTIANTIGYGAPTPDEWRVSINNETFYGNTIGVFTVSTVASGQVVVSVYGKDIGFWGGWYGPIFQAPTVTSPVIVVDTPTATVETHTPQVVETVTPSTSDSQTPTLQPETSTSESQTPNLDTSDSSVVAPVPSSETRTVISVPVETLTVVETLTPVESATPVVETGTVPAEIAPLPTPVPAVEPQPVPQPEPVVVVPQPEPQPRPDPVVESPVVEPETVTDEEAPLEEQPLEETPSVEEQQPVEEPAEHPTEEETPTIPDETPEQIEPTPEPLPLPIEEPEQDSQPDIAPEPPIVQPQVIEASKVDLSTLAPDTPVLLENGVVLTAEVAIAIQLLQNPAELVSELFSDPGAALAALGSVGADMTPEVREKSEKVLVSAVIAGNIATQAAATAGAVAAYRRKP